MRKTNEEYLETLLNYYDVFYYHSNQMIYILDPNLNILRYNDICLSIWKESINLQQKNNGANFISDFFKNHHLADKIKEIYHTVLQSRNSQKFIGINFKRTEQYIILCIEINPIINDQSGEVIALECRAYLPDYPIHWYKISELFEPKPEESINNLPSSKYGNCPPENEILFLMFHFDTHEEIANILSILHKIRITKNAIGKIIRRKLYPKFEVNTLKELKEKAARENFHKNIPTSLMPEIIIMSHEL